MGWSCSREDNGFHVTPLLPEHPELENNGVAPYMEDLVGRTGWHSRQGKARDLGYSFQPLLSQVLGACTPSPFLPPEHLAFGREDRGRIQEGILSIASFLTCLRSFPCSSTQAEEVKEGSPEGTRNNVGV